MTFDHILLFSQKCNLPTCDSFRSDGSQLYASKYILANDAIHIALRIAILRRARLYLVHTHIYTHTPANGAEGRWFDSTSNRHVHGPCTLVKSVEFYYTLSSTLVWSYHSSTEVWSLSIKKCGVFLFHTRCAP